MSKSPYTKALMASEFWLDTPLQEMNKMQWEAVCDGCAKCCLHKYIDDDSCEENAYVAEPTDSMQENEEVHFTNIACSLLHTKKCECTKYEQRSVLVPHCVTLSKENLKDIFYMPPSCSYRRLHEGRGLAKWHPLLNNGKKTIMHELDLTVRGKIVSEEEADISRFEEYIVTWPLNDAD